MSYQFFSNSTPTSIPRQHPIAGFTAARHTQSAGQRHLAAIIGLWLARSRQRRHLGELAEWDDHLLKDIGVSRDAALREAAKPFWRR
jgi:uncharacterized protein YjiS (DUF1127 family)